MKNVKSRKFIDNDNSFVAYNLTKRANNWDTEFSLSDGNTTMRWSFWDTDTYNGLREGVKEFETLIEEMNKFCDHMRNAMQDRETNNIMFPKTKYNVTGSLFGDNDLFGDDMEPPKKAKKKPSTKKKA